MINFLTIGADPEVFVFNKKLNQHVPVFGMLGGTKNKPIPVEGPRKGFSVQEDNVMAEYNIPPATNKKEFIEYNMFMLEALSIFLPENCFISQESFVKFSEKELSHPKAMEFGCAPSINAYTLDVFEPLFDVSTSEFRAAGGHIHLGFKEHKCQETKLKLVQALDKTLGIRSYIEDFEKNPEINRFYSYGGFGNFRETDFGIEYRTTSNWWIKNSKTISEAYDLVQKAFKLVNNNDFEFNPNEIDLKIAKEINEKNLKLVNN